VLRHAGLTDIPHVPRTAARPTPTAAAAAAAPEQPAETANTYKKAGKLFLGTGDPVITDEDVTQAYRSHGIAHRSAPPSCKVLTNKAVPIAQMYNAVLQELEDSDNNFEAAVDGRFTFTEVCMAAMATLRMLASA
jgi:hypothetical protein